MVSTQLRIPSYSLKTSKSQQTHVLERMLWFLFLRLKVWQRFPYALLTIVTVMCAINLSNCNHLLILRALPIALITLITLRILIAVNANQSNSKNSYESG